MENLLKNLYQEIDLIKTTIYKVIFEYRTRVHSAMKDKDNLMNIQLLTRKSDDEIQKDITDFCSKECEKYIKLFDECDQFVNCLLNNEKFSNICYNYIAQVWNGDIFQEKQLNGLRNVTLELEDVINNIEKNIFNFLYYKNSS